MHYIIIDFVFTIYCNSERNQPAIRRLMVSNRTDFQFLILTFEYSYSKEHDQEHHNTVSTVSPAYRRSVGWVRKGFGQSQFMVSTQACSAGVTPTFSCIQPTKELLSVWRLTSCFPVPICGNCMLRSAIRSSQISNPSFSAELMGMTELLSPNETCYHCGLLS